MPDFTHFGSTVSRFGHAGRDSVFFGIADDKLRKDAPGLVTDLKKLRKHFETGKKKHPLMTDAGKALKRPSSKKILRKTAVGADVHHVLKHGKPIKHRTMKADKREHKFQPIGHSLNKIYKKQLAGQQIAAHHSKTVGKGVGPSL